MAASPPADPDELRAAARQFSDGADFIQSVQQHVSHIVTDLVSGANRWEGAASEQFQGTWNRLEQDAAQAAEALQRTSQVLTRFAQAIEDVQSERAWKIVEGVGLGILTIGLVVVDALQAGADPVTDGATVVSADAAAGAFAAVEEGFAAAESEAVAGLDAVADTATEVGEVEGNIGEVAAEGEPVEVPNESPNNVGEVSSEAETLEGPGQWSAENESMSESAAQYQEQITGHTTGEVYRVGDVKFDGFQDGKLLDAKGPGYEKFFDASGNPKPWWNGSQSLVDQAERQIAAADGTPIEWHVAEEGAANGIRQLLQNAGYGDFIKVIWTPPL